MSLVPYLSEPGLRLGRVVFHDSFSESTATGQAFDLPGYSAVRAGRWKYAEYHNGDRELYDLAADPDELRSMHADQGKSAILAELAGLVEGFRTCEGAQCVVTGYSDAWPRSDRAYGAAERNSGHGELRE